MHTGAPARVTPLADLADLADPARGEITHPGTSPQAITLPAPERLVIIAIEDRRDDIDLIRFALEDGGIDAELLVADDADSLQRHLTCEPQLVLCDYNLPRFSPQAALALLAGLERRVPLIVVTRAIGEAAAVDVLRHGARDCVPKDRLATLPQVIRRVLAEERSAFQGRLAQQRLQAAHQRLRAMSARMITVQERERQIIAAELHDGLGQTLTSVLLHLDAAERLDDSAVAASYRHTATQLVRETLDQIRTLSFTLRPAQLDLLGLASAVRTAADMQLRPLGLVAHLRVRGDLERAGATSAAVLYRVVLGALTNVVRHAHSSQVHITLAMHGDDRVSATVLDNGVGFDAKAAMQRPDRSTRTGLTSMVERAELAGGQLRIRSRRGRGTAVRVVL